MVYPYQVIVYPSSRRTCLSVSTKKPSVSTRPLLYSYLPLVAFILAFNAFTFSGV